MIKCYDLNNDYCAMSPKLTPVNEVLHLSLELRGCTHFLLFSGQITETFKLEEQGWKDYLESMSDEELLQEQEHDTHDPGVKMKCISFVDYRANGNRLTLPCRAGAVAVCGLHQSEQEIKVFMPTEYVSYFAAYALNIQYRIIPVMKKENTGFAIWKKEKEEFSGFYLVEFLNSISEYADGSIIYTFPSIPFAFPVTKEMISNRKMIIKGSGPERNKPQLMSRSSGLNLVNLSEL